MERDGGGRGVPSITWEIALALFMCVYTPTRAARTRPRRFAPHRAASRPAPGHAGPRQAVPFRIAPCPVAVLRSGYR